MGTTGGAGAGGASGSGTFGGSGGYSFLSDHVLAQATQKLGELRDCIVSNSNGREDKGGVFAGIETLERLTSEFYSLIPHNFEMANIRSERYCISTR